MSSGGLSLEAAASYGRHRWAPSRTGGAQRYSLCPPFSKKKKKKKKSHFSPLFSPPKSPLFTPRPRAFLIVSRSVLVRSSIRLVFLVATVGSMNPTKGFRRFSYLGFVPGRRSPESVVLKTRFLPPRAVRRGGVKLLITLRVFTR